MKRFRTFVLLCCVVVSLPRAAFAGVDWTEALLVRGMIFLAATALQEEGFTRFRDQYNQLNSGEQRTQTFTFEEGYTYVVFGVGDSNTGNLSFDLMQGGQKVKSDLSIADCVHFIPFFSVNSRQKLSIRITMRQCNVDTCAYGFAIFQKPLGGSSTGPPQPWDYQQPPAGWTPGESQVPWLNP